MSNFTVKQIKAVLSANGLPTENLDAAATELCSRHKTSLDAIIEERDGFKEKAGLYESVKKELDELKKTPSEDWKKKYDAVKKEFEDYKSGVEAEKTLASKKNAVKSVIEDAGIKDPAIVELIMLKTKYDDIQLDGDKVKDAEALTNTIKTDYSAYVEKDSKGGAKVDNPPKNNGGKMTKQEIMAISDDDARIKAIAENRELFERK